MAAQGEPWPIPERGTCPHSVELVDRGDDVQDDQLVDVSRGIHGHAVGDSSSAIMSDHGGAVLSQATVGALVC